MSDKPQPLAFRWTGEVMWPLRRDAAAQRFDESEIYLLDIHRQRVPESHRHYFACLNNAWPNLSELDTERWPTPEHLRKWALIQCGYRNERTFVCNSKAQARDFAAFMRPIDDYAVIVAREAVVVEWTAKSQSQKAMGAADFEESKAKVLDTVSRLIGISVDDLKRNAKVAA